MKKQEVGRAKSFLHTYIDLEYKREEKNKVLHLLGQLLREYDKIKEAVSYKVKKPEWANWASFLSKEGQKADEKRQQVVKEKLASCGWVRNYGQRNGLVISSPEYDVYVEPVESSRDSECEIVIWKKAGV